MRKAIHSGLLKFLLLLLVTFIMPAQASEDSSAISIQVVVKESTGASCNIGFKRNAISLHQSQKNNCNVNRKKLMEKALQLTQAIKQHNGLQIVTVTITAP